MWYSSFNRQLSGLIFAALLATTLGCSQEETFQKITGVVQLDGVPLEHGTIIFSPIEQQGMSSAAEVVEGKFVCKIMPGDKMVAIRAYEGGMDEMAMPVGKQLLPAKYNDPTELTASVKNESGQTFEFELESR